MKNLTAMALLFVLFHFGFNTTAQTVTLDYYFNHEVHKNKAGQEERYHYLWDETANSGFSVFGDAFKNAGAKINSLEEAPTVSNLKASNIYIIVDPDTKKESLHPNYIMEKDINEIEKWVKAGGVLVMMANDRSSVIITNSLSLIGNAIAKSKGFESVSLFFDRNQPGHDASLAFNAQVPHVLDCSAIYEGFEDYNDQLRSRIGSAPSYSARAPVNAGEFVTR